MNQPPAGPRFMLWVDGVGGYLTCLSSSVRIGQALPGTQVEIPVVGDLSRIHATISRSGEAYVVEPHGPIRVGQRELQSAHLLSDGDELQLGNSFRVRFRQPHALSGSGRLEFLSGHRTHPSADGVLLMSGSCILGPAPSNHVICREWRRDVMLVRQGQAFAVHVPHTFEVDGKLVDRRAAIGLDSRIQGDDFCLSLERID